MGTYKTKFLMLILIVGLSAARIQAFVNLKVLSRTKTFFELVVALLLTIATAAAANGQTSSGGAYTMTKTVVAGGGGDLQQNQTSAGNTVGQTVAGKQSSGGNFTLYTGFWTPDNFAPTAANAVVGGQIKTPDGRGIRNVRVTITYSSGQTQTALSATFGYYRFAEIPVGATYVIGVAAKKYVFTQSTQIRTILDDTMDINFIADSLP